MDLKTGWIVEEKVEGIGRWFRTNSWIYEDEGKAIDLAERRLEIDSVTEVQVVKIKHTDPARVWGLSKENK